MPQVVIIGNSGAARECYWLLEDMLHAAPGLRRYYEFKGFLSWKGYPNNLKNLDSYFLGDADAYDIGCEDMFVIGIAHPSLRRAVYEEFKARKATFLTLVHPWSDVSQAAIIGEANIFQRGSSVFCDTVIGNANYFNGAINLAHDVVMGDYNFVGPATLILGDCRVGSENSFGARSTLLPKARVGNGNIFAPGCVVYKGCRDNCRMAGNPALNVGSVDGVSSS